MSPSPDSSAYGSTERLASGTDDPNGLDFVIRQVLLGLSTTKLVRVEAVSGETVDVRPLVTQVDGAGDKLPHGVVYGLPFTRLQGGLNAVILDPQPGDIGFAVFCDRDISIVKTTKAEAAPGSRRVFDMADGLYIGGLLNATPTQFVRFTSEGVEIVSPTKVTVQAPAIELNGAVTGNSTAVFQGDVTGAGKSLATHRHSGVTTGGGTSGPPV